MDIFEITYAAALLAGLLSFASPCVLPLVPAYLCFLGGMTFDQLKGDEDGRTTRLVWPAVAFVLGFSAVFVAMGASATAVNRLLFAHLDWLSMAAGLVIVVLGLHYVGVFRISFLDMERRFHVERRPAGLVGAFIIGLAFGFGWTPCVGPVLATVLLMAAQHDSPLYGISLLSAYAAGIGLPFLAAAVAAGPFLRLMGGMRHHYRKVEIALGSILVMTGILIATGWINELGFWMLRAFPWLGRFG
jgi:cytochrome c-type biogenesis protein